MILPLVKESETDNLVALSIMSPAGQNILMVQYRTSITKFR